ncbi:hypothetical protein KUV73_05775 [Mameliella alba]|nr:hypothetical protein [Mameliella alba]MBY6168918.1 hypothetical protein [Mameliella alba]MBY6173861.1 hypothetical protein [Mameliella alba]
MTSRLIVALLVGALAPSAAIANCWGGGSYTEDLEGVYSQNWWVENVRSNGNGTCAVTLKGEGKTGDFRGDLTVSCGASASWMWGAVYQSYPDKQSVPHEALVALSASVCAAY